MARRKKRNNKGAGVQYVRLPYIMLRHDNFKALSNHAVRIYIEIRHRFNGANNGYIGLSCRDAAQSAHCSPNTAQKALKELEHYGFIICRRVGTFGNRKASEFIITCEQFNFQPATNEWRNSCAAFDKKRKEKPRRNECDLQSPQSDSKAYMEQQIMETLSR